MGLRAIFFLFILALPLAAQNVLLDQRYDAKRQTSIRITALASQLPTAGYIPVRVELRNDEKSPVTWTIDTIATNNGYYSREGDAELSATHSLSCPVGESRSFDLSLPVLTDFSALGGSSYSPTNLSLTIKPTGGLPQSEAYLRTLHQEDWPSVLISETLYLPKKIELDNVVNPGGSRSGVEFGAAFDPKKMSADWHAYLGYQVILMSDQDWLAIAPAAQRAILSALRFGGELRLFYENQQPSWGSLQLPDNADNQQAHGLGLIRRSPYAASGPFDPNQIVHELKSAYQNDNLLSQAGDDFTNKNPLVTLLGEKPFNIALVVIVLIIFGIVVGPINLFVFTKDGQRHKLFITTPIISLVASFLLFLIIIFQDGFGGNGHRAVLMQVYPGESENTAYLSQEQITRTGLLVNTSFKTEAGAWMTPAILRNSRWTRVNDQNYGAGNTYQLVENEEATEHRGDWFQSRSEQAHLLVASRPTRGRIELASAAEGEKGPVIRSTFDFPLDELFYRDDSGAVWFAENVSNAAPVTLKKSSGAQSIVFLQKNAEYFGSRLSKRVHTLGSEKGIFLAHAENGPAIENYTSIKWRSSHTVITGPIFKP